MSNWSNSHETNFRFMAAASPYLRARLDSSINSFIVIKLRSCRWKDQRPVDDSYSTSPAMDASQYELLRTQDRSLSNFDIRHLLVISYFYTPPLGAGRGRRGCGAFSHILGEGAESRRSSCSPVIFLPQSLPHTRRGPERKMPIPRDVLRGGGKCSHPAVSSSGKRRRQNPRESR